MTWPNNVIDEDGPSEDDVVRSSLRTNPKKVLAE